MPLPFFIGAVIATMGAGKAISNILDANETMKVTEESHAINLERIKMAEKRTTKTLERLNDRELKIIKSFTEFSDVVEKIQNRPEFKSYSKKGVMLPVCKIDEIKKSSSVATRLLTVSGGGVALGALPILGVAPAIIMIAPVVSLLSKKISENADESWSYMRKAETKINEACDYLYSLDRLSKKYIQTLTKVETVYLNQFSKVQKSVLKDGKKDWLEFTAGERLAFENTVLLVGLLYHMCKVSIVLESENNEEFSPINYEEVNKSVDDAKNVVTSMELIGSDIKVEMDDIGCFKMRVINADQYDLGKAFITGEILKGEIFEGDQVETKGSCGFSFHLQINEISKDGRVIDMAKAGNIVTLDTHAVIRGTGAMPFIMLEKGDEIVFKE